MKKRMLTLLVALTVTIGSLAPATPAYAVDGAYAAGTVASENSKEALEDASAESSEDAGKELSEEGSEAGEDSGNETGTSGEDAASDNTATEPGDNNTSDDKSDDTSDQSATEPGDNDTSDNASDKASDNASDKTSDEADEASASEEASSAESEAAADDSDAASTEGSEEELTDESSDAASEASSEDEIIEEVNEKKLVEYNFLANCYDTKTRIAADENGKVITGWINVDISEKKDGEEAATTYEIKAVGSAALARAEGTVYYISPDTRKAVVGVNSIGGKKYLFFQSGIGMDGKECQLARGGEGKTLVRSGYIAYYCVLPSGEICTGWQTIDGEEYHFSTSVGVRDEMRWITRGKGFTYVDQYGRRVDKYNHSLDEDDVHFINDGQYTTESRSEEFYVFKGGVRLTGLIYFDKDDKVTTAAKAVYARYCDPLTGIVKAGFITAGGKKYYAGDETFPSVSKEADLKEARFYGRFKLGSIAEVAGVTNGYVFIEKSGAVAVNKLLTIEGKTYFAREDGLLCADEYRMIKGKLCYFNNKGEMVASSVPVTDYKVSSDGTKVTYTGSIYADGTDGVLFYTDAACTQVLSNTWLVKTGDDGKVRRIYYLDKNGRAVKGFVTIDKKRYAFDTQTGMCINSSEGISGGPTKVSGKYYLITGDGEVLTKTGFISYSGHYYYIKNASGQLATGLTTIKGKKYYFHEYGMLNEDSTVTIGNKTYVINPEGSGETAYILSQKQIKALIKAMAEAYGPEAQKQADYMTCINSDGSLGSGWRTIKGKKVYFYHGSNVGASSFSETTIYNIDGKMYLFEPEYGSVIKNRYLELEDKESFRIYYFGGAVSQSYNLSSDGITTFYFGSDGAAVTGFKTVNGKKHYFCKKDGEFSGGYIGMMAKNTTLTINGKIFSFDEEGLISTPDSEEFHYNKDGSYATGRTVVKTDEGKKIYYHDPATGSMEKNVIRKTGNKWYYYGYDGYMETSLHFSKDKKGCVAKFNQKDGSITGFYQPDGDKEIKLANTYIVINSRYYFLGSNGLPVTGLYKLNDSDSMDLCSNTSCRMYIESDGDCEYRSYISESKVGYMRKIGGKIYVLINGHTVPSLGSDGVPVRYTVSDYSSLPAADRSYLEMCSEQISGSYNGRVDAVVKTDGSVGAWTFINPDFDRERLYINKYGVPINYMGLFARVGKNWYVTGDVASACTETHEATNAMGDDVTLVFSWDNDLKLGKVRELESGKPANGYYKLQESRDPVMFFKNGAIQTGKHNVMLGGFYPMTYYINPDTGWYLD